MVTGKEEQLYQLIFVSLTVISCVVLFLIFIAFFVQKKIQHYSNWQIVFLSFSSFISSLSYLINYRGLRNIDDRGFLCQFQGFIMLWSDMSVYSWSTIINYSVYYYTIHFDRINSDVIPLAWWVGDAVIGYIIPFSYALIIKANDKIGVNDKDYCWILDTCTLNYFTLFTYIIAWLFMLINIILSIKVIVYICKLNKEDQEYAKNFVQKLLLFPMIQIIASFPMTIYRILFFIVANLEKYIFMKYCGLYGFACMGIAIGLLFGKNVNLYENVFRLCFRKDNTSKTSSVIHNDNAIFSALNLKSSILENEDSLPL